MKRLTVWEKEENIINSEYGDIFYKDWCEKEMERLSKGRKLKHIMKTNIKHDTRLCAIYRSK